MSDEQSADTLRIAAYLAGGGTPEERARTQAWIAASSERVQELEALERVWRAAEGMPAPVDAEAMWDVLARQIGVASNGTPMPAVVRQPGGEVAVAERRVPGRALVGTSHARRLWYSVATLAVVAAAGVVGWQAKGRLFGSNNRSTTTYATGNGQRANIHLPDGTTVVLNVASRLDVTEFTSGQRQVALQGEAYFTVAHETGAPFTVVVGKTRAKVLGTSFVVRHYAADSTTLIAVKDGRIAVHSAVVEAAQQVAVLPNGAMVRGVADPSEYTFATGTLTLAPMPLPQAIVELNRWYDADIRLGDSSLASLGVGGKFVAGSVSDLAPILEGTLGVRAVRDGNRLTLYAQ